MLCCALGKKQHCATLLIDLLFDAADHDALKPLRLKLEKLTCIFCTLGMEYVAKTTWNSTNSCWKCFLHPTWKNWRQIPYVILFNSPGYAPRNFSIWNVSPSCFRILSSFVFSVCEDWNDPLVANMAFCITVAASQSSRKVPADSFWVSEGASEWGFRGLLCKERVICSITALFLKSSLLSLAALLFLSSFFLLVSVLSSSLIARNGVMLNFYCDVCSFFSARFLSLLLLFPPLTHFPPLVTILKGCKSACTTILNILWATVHTRDKSTRLSHSACLLHSLSVYSL